MMIKMHRISGKLSEHFAFLDTDGATYENGTAVFVVFLTDFKNWSNNRFTVVNFWRLIDYKIFNLYSCPHKCNTTTAIQVFFTTAANSLQVFCKL